MVRGDKMSIKSKIKTLLSSSNVKPKELAPALNVAQQTAINRLSTGITSISDLIRICNYCGASLTITTKEKTIIPLTIEDIEK